MTLNGNAGLNSGITVAASASLTLQSDIVEYCGTSASGGGILNNGGTVSVAQSTFSHDAGTINGGAIAELGGSVSITQSTFDANNAGDFGGAIFAASNSSGDSGELTVLASTFAENLAQHGGAIDLGFGGDATVVESTFTENVAEIAGGAIALYNQLGNSGQSMTLRLSGSTVTGNISGGIDVEAAVNEAPTFAQPVLLSDSIVAGNTPDVAGDADVDGAVNPASAFNLIGNGTGVTGVATDANGNMIGTNANPINPELGPLQNNGGPTLTMAPLPGSPAIDRGGPDPVGDDYTSTDQAGNPRIVVQPDSVLPVGGDGRDIGAIELGLQTPTILTVNSTADAKPPAGVLTLREALEAVNGTVPFSSLSASQVKIGSPYIDEINFSVTGTIALASVLPAVDASALVAVDGPGASDLLIQGDGLSDAIFTVAPDASLTVASLTLSEPPPQLKITPTNSGVTVGINAVLGIEDAVIENVFDGSDGGAIFNQAGFVTLTASEVQDASAVNYGGGIAALGGSVGVSQCLFTDNVALQNGGGAIDLEGSLGGNAGTPGALTIVDSTFSYNTSPEAGGALYLGKYTVTSITNSTFVGNTAVQGGAIDEFDDPTLTVDDSTLTGNSDSNGGGGIYSNIKTDPMSATILQNSIVAGNFLTGNPSAPSDLVGTIASASANNLIGDASQVTIPGGMSVIPLTNGYNGNLVGTESDPIKADLGPLQNNGGPTPTAALLPGSPAIGAGLNPLNGVNLLTDQRGYAPASGSPWDIGAYQSTARPDLSSALSAANVGVASYGQTSYTFSVAYTDNVAGGLIGSSNLTGSIVTVIPPGGGTPITAKVINTPVATGPTDPWGDANAFTITYEIVPPGGAWTSRDNGGYSVDVNGTPITETAGDPAANGTVATFQVETASNRHHQVRPDPQRQDRHMVRDHQSHQHRFLRVHRPHLHSVQAATGRCPRERHRNGRRHGLHRAQRRQPGRRRNHEPDTPLQLKREPQQLFDVVLTRLTLRLISPTRRKEGIRHDHSNVRTSPARVTGRHRLALAIRIRRGTDV